jgi:hypothetical protein
MSTTVVRPIGATSVPASLESDDDIHFKIKSYRISAGCKNLSNRLIDVYLADKAMSHARCGKLHDDFPCMYVHPIGPRSIYIRSSSSYGTHVNPATTPSFRVENRHLVP